MLSRTFFIATSFVALLHCGGSTDSSSSDCQALMQHTSSSCSVEGEKCVSPAQSCSNQTLYCTCESGKFSCEAPPMNCGTCPSPGLVSAGGACTLSIETSCPSTTGHTDCQGQFVADYCTCMNGVFECSSSPWPPCSVDGGSD